MVKSEDYDMDDICTRRKLSCDDNDEDDGGVILQSDWVSNNEQNAQGRRRKSLEEGKDQSLPCELILMHSNCVESSRTIGNESALSSSSSSTSNEGAIGGIFLSPQGNNRGSNDIELFHAQLDDKRIRRQIANCNERRRMQSINAGFQALRQLLPYKEGEKMSKAAILQQTADFIHNLQEEKNRLLEENELIAQTKKRRIENSSNINEKMDILEDSRSFVTIKDRNVRTNVSCNETSLDALECLKTIQDLRKELFKEQQLRMVYETELRNKSSAPTPYAVQTNLAYATNKTVLNSLPSSLYMDASLAFNDTSVVETYQQKLQDAQTQQKTSNHSFVSPFSAISSLQDALNTASPLLLAPQQTVINSPQNVLACSSKTQPQVMIQKTLSASESINSEISSKKSLPSAIIVSDSAIINTRSVPTTITFALSADASASIGTTAKFQSIHHQPSHVVLDVTNTATNHLLTLKTNHTNPQYNSLIIDTSSVTVPTVSESTSANTPMIITTSRSQTFPKFFHPLMTYPNNDGGNLLVQVDNRRSRLSSSSGGFSSSISTNLSNNTIPTTLLSPPLLPISSSACIDLSIPCIVSSSAASNKSDTFTIQNSDVDKKQSTSTITSANNGAPMSQRNLQAILDAIRHIEGGSITAAAINNNSSSTSCTQASDLLVR